MRRKLLYVLSALLLLPSAIQAQSKVLRLTVSDIPSLEGFFEEQLFPLLIVDGTTIGEFHYYDGKYESYVDLPVGVSSVDVVLWSSAGIAPSAPIKWDLSGQPGSDGCYEKNVSMSDYKKVTFSIPDGYTGSLSIGRESVVREYRTYTEGDDSVDSYGRGKTTSIWTVDGESCIYAQPGHYYYYGTLNRQSDNTTFDDLALWEFDVNSTGVNQVAVPAVDPSRFTIVTFNVKGVDGQNADSLVQFGTSSGYTSSSYGDGKLRWAVLSGSPVTWRASISTGAGIVIAPMYGSVNTSEREVSVDVDFSSLKKTELRAVGLSDRGFSGVNVVFEGDGSQDFIQNDDGSYSLSFYTKSGREIEGNVIVTVERESNYVSPPAVKVSTTAGKDVVMDFGKYSYVSFSVEGDDMSPSVSIRKAGTSDTYFGTTGSAFLEKGEYEAKCDYYLSDYQMSIPLSTEFTVDGSGKDLNVVFSLKNEDYAVLTVNVINIPAYSGNLAIGFDYENDSDSHYTYFSLSSATTAKLLLKKGNYKYSADINIEDSYVDDMSYPISGNVNVTGDCTVTLDLAKYRIVEMDVKDGESSVMYYCIVIDNKLNSDLEVYEESGKLAVLIIPDGSYDIAVAAGGYAMCKKNVTIDASTKKLTFNMTKADCYPLSVYAFDKNSYDGVIPNCTISVEGIGRMIGDNSGYAYTGDLENFLAVPFGTYNITVSAPGYSDYNGEIVVDTAHADEDGWVYFEVDMTERRSGVDVVAVDDKPVIKYDGNMLRVESEMSWGILVYDLSGRILLQTEKSELNVSGLPAGIYIAVAVNGRETVRTKIVLGH